MTKKQLVEAMKAAMEKAAVLKHARGHMSYLTGCYSVDAEKCISRLHRGLVETKAKYELQIILDSLNAHIVWLLDLFHADALVMNDQYDVQLEEIQYIERQSVINADLVKVCSMRMFLFQRSQRQHAYTLISYDKYVNPLFDLLDNIASDLAGYRVYASEHNWIVESAAYAEAEAREYVTYEYAAPAPIEAAETTANPYEILLNLMGEDAFCKAILKPEAYAAYQERKAATEIEVCDSCGHTCDNMHTVHADDPDNVKVLCDPCYFDEHAYDFNRELNTFEDLHPARPTGFENELKRIW